MMNGRALAGWCSSALLMAVLAASAHAQPFGYVVNAGDPAADGSHDNLWRVNLASGETQRIGALGLTLPGTNVVQSDVEGLALETSSLLYGINDATDSMVLISLQTGTAATPNMPVDNLRLGLSGVELDPGLTFACNGDLLMSAANRRTLYRLDRATGQATAIGGEGRLGVRIGDIAAFRDTLYGIGINGDEGLYRIDAEQGTATRIGSFGINISLANAGLDSTSSGALWAVGNILVGGQPQPSRILRIDPETGAATLGSTTLVGVKGLAISPTNCTAPEDPPDPPPDEIEPKPAPVDSPLALALFVLLAMVIAARRLRVR